MQVAGNMSWVHTILETGITELNLCYNLHKRRATTQKKQTSPAGSGLGYHWEVCAEVCRAGMLSVIGHVAYGLILRLWRLKPSPMKTVTSVFHLLNTSAARELRVHMEGQQVRQDPNLIPWGYNGQDSELPATPYKDCRKVTKSE